MTISSILFICLGNICRSPLAQGVFLEEASKWGMLEKLHIDSAGTGGWHIGNPPDPRSMEIAAKYNIDITGQTCRRLSPADFHDFDLILGMDKENIRDCKAANTSNGAAQIEMFTQYGGLGNMEIPDPYYGGSQGFDVAYQLIKQSSTGTLERIKNQNNG